MKINHKVTLAVMIALGSHALSGLARGAEAPQPAAASANDAANLNPDVLQEVTVTAQRRRQSLQSVPI